MIYYLFQYLACEPHQYKKLNDHSDFAFGTFRRLVIAVLDLADLEAVDELVLPQVVYET